LPKFVAFLVCNYYNVYGKKFIKANDKGKSAERRRRKATGLRPFGVMAAGLPKVQLFIV